MPSCSTCIASTPPWTRSSRPASFWRSSPASSRPSGPTRPTWRRSGASWRKAQWSRGRSPWAARPGGRDQPQCRARAVRRRLQPGGPAVLAGLATLREGPRPRDGARPRQDRRGHHGGRCRPGPQSHAQASQSGGGVLPPAPLHPPTPSRLSRPGGVAPGQGCGGGGPPHQPERGGGEPPTGRSGRHGARAHRARGGEPGPAPRGGPPAGVPPHRAHAPRAPGAGSSSWPRAPTP